MFLYRKSHIFFVQSRLRISRLLLRLINIRRAKSAKR